MKASIELIALLISLSTTVIGAIAWYNTAQRKRFASQEEWRKVMVFQGEISERLKKISEEIFEHDDLTSRQFQDAAHKIQRELMEMENTIEKLSIIIAQKLTIDCKIDKRD